MAECGQERYISDGPLLFLKTRDEENMQRAACAAKRGSASTKTFGLLLELQGSPGISGDLPI